MNTNSKLCNLIFNNINTWEKDCKDLSIRVKIEYPLAIFNYNINADFTDDIVRESRGIIIRLDTLEVVCWPFTKFCNVHEEGAKKDLDNFDWEHCSCQEKIDGSIMKLFWNPFIKDWQWATNSCINAKDAGLNSKGGKNNYLKLLKSAINFNKINTDNLNKDFTYIFELVSPENQLVVKYEETKLYHLGTRNNKTGKEMNIDIGVEKPILYNFHTLEDCIEACKHLNSSEFNVEKEGFVVVDPNYHRVKIKSSEYIMMHRATDLGRLSKNQMITLLRSGEVDIDELLEKSQTIGVYYKYYEFKLLELEWNINRYLTYARNLFEELGEDRKALALSIKKDKFAPFGFAGIGNEKTAKDLLLTVSDNKIANFIEDYKMLEIGKN